MNGKIVEDGQAYEVYTSQKELEETQEEFSGEMLVESIVKKLENGISSAQPILIDTSSFNREKLRDCIAISKEIERQEQLNKSHRRLNNPTPLEATMIHEEIFECIFENDPFLMTLEDENLFGSCQVTDLDATQIIENAMQYFDENVNVDSGPSRGATPTKLPCTGTVAAAIGSSKTHMSKFFGSPPPSNQDIVANKSCCEKIEKEVPTSITKELQKKYEQYVVERQKPQEKTHKSKDQRKSAPPVLPTTTLKSQKSQNLSRKSKVKQLVQKFNSKISQLMSHNSTEKKDSKSSIAKPSEPLFVKLTSELDKSRQHNHFSFSSTPAKGVLVPHKTGITHCFQCC